MRWLFPVVPGLLLIAPAVAQMSPPPGTLKLPSPSAAPATSVRDPGPPSVTAAPVGSVTRVGPSQSDTAVPPPAAKPKAKTPPKHSAAPPVVRPPTRPQAQRPPGGPPKAPLPPVPPAAKPAASGGTAAAAGAVAGAAGAAAAKSPATPETPAKDAPASADAAAPPPNKGSVTGLPLPRFAALRSDEVNLRVGPGLRFPIDWQYHRRDLPVEIERENDVWRLIRDQDGVRGWVHAATLVGHRSFVVTGKTDQIVRRAPRDDSDPVAQLKPGVVGRIRSCEGSAEWCEVQVGEYRGWLRRVAFFGTYPNEPVGG